MNNPDLMPFLLREQHEQVRVLPPEEGAPEALVPFLESDTYLQPLVRRQEYLTDTWISINMARAARPFTMPAIGQSANAGDRCLFCAGNEARTPRDAETGGDTLRSPQQGEWQMRAFPNLYPWLSAHVNLTETGLHKTTMAELSWQEVHQALNGLASLCKMATSSGKYPVIFKNHGFGASIAHHHWQAGSLPHMPGRVAAEYIRAKTLRKQFGCNAFDAIIDTELTVGERNISSSRNEDVFIMTPFAPRTNFEIWLIPTQQVSSLDEASPELLLQFAQSLHQILTVMETKLGINSLSILIMQTTVADPDYRLHFRLIPYKHYGGAERGFEEYVVEVTPQTACLQLRELLQIERNVV